MTRRPVTASRPSKHLADTPFDGTTTSQRDARCRRSAACVARTAASARYPLRVHARALRADAAPVRAWESPSPLVVLGSRRRARRVGYHVAPGCARERAHVPVRDRAAQAALPAGVRARI